MPSLGEAPARPIACRVVAERLVLRRTRAPAQQRVVADLRMGVERQVVGGEADVVLEQRPQALGEQRRQPGRAGSPRTGRGGRGPARPRARPRARSAPAAPTRRSRRGDLGRAGHLQPVRPESSNAPGSSSSSSERMRSSICAMEFEVRRVWAIRLTLSAAGRRPGAGRATSGPEREDSSRRGVGERSVRGTAPASCAARPADRATASSSPRVRRGDDRAFEPLYARYQRRIAAYVLGMVKDHGRAEDITQEVFVSALRRMRETDRPIAFKPWIYEIAKNACIDAVPPLPARRGGLLRRRGRPRAGRLRPPRRRRPDARRRGRRQAGARPPLRRVRRPVRDRTTRSSCCASSRACRYREIGERLGMSRPARREHALPRAQAPDRGVRRARLAAQRCARIQAIIAAAAAAAPGRARPAPPRAPRRPLPAVPPPWRWPPGSTSAVARPRTPVRRVDRARRRLPAAPAFLRARFFASEQMVPVSEPMAAGWSKAVAAGAALLVAGVGAGVAPHARRQAARAQARQRQARRRDTRSASPSSGTRVRRPMAAGAAQAGGREVDEPHRRQAQRLARQAAQHRAEPRAGTPSSRRRRPAARPNPPRRTRPAPRRTRRAPSTCRPAARDGATRRACRRSSCPRSIRPPAHQVGGAVKKTVNDATGTVNQATRGRAGHGRTA